MNGRSPFRPGFELLELLLAVALVVLVLQLFPALWAATVWAFDVRNWPRTVWFAINWVVIFALVVIRFGPDLYHDWTNRRERLAADRAKKQKQQESKEHREVIARMKEGMKRRI